MDKCYKSIFKTLHNKLNVIGAEFWNNICNNKVKYEMIALKEIPHNWLKSCSVAPFSKIYSEHHIYHLSQPVYYIV